MANKYKILPIPDDAAWDRKGGIWLRFKRLFWKFFNDTKFEKFISTFLFHKIDDFIQGLVNFSKWYKIIWFDRNWDWRYIYEILEKKLYLQREELVKANRHEDIQRDNKYLTITLNLIDKIKDEFYHMEYFDYQELGEWIFTPTGDKIYNPITNEEEETSTLDIPLISEKYDEFLDKYKSSVRYVKKNVNPEYWKDKKGLVMHVANHNEEKARKLLFKVIESQICHWWD